jgi:fructan beta-fructosidase
MFELPVENADASKWVLLVSFNGDKGSDMQYFIGEFDGSRFINENPADRVLTLDDGTDFYAGVTWNNVPDHRRLGIGWFNNWKYAEAIPTSVWRSAQSLVREFTLREFPEGVRLVQQPVASFQELRTAHQHFDNINVGEQSSTNNAIVAGNTLEIIAEFAYEADSVTGLSEVSEFGLLVFKGEGQETAIGYDVASQSMFVDRTNSGEVSFHKDFPVRVATLMPTDDNHVKLHIFVDKSSIEVFGNDGYKTMSVRVFPDEAKDQVEVYAIGGGVTLLSLDVCKLNSIWHTPSL